MTSQSTDYHLVGNVGIVIGVALVLLAIPVLLTNMKINRTFDFWGNVTGVSFEFPNVQYSIGLAVVGIVFGAFGSASRIKAKPQIQPPPFSKTPSFCPYCGTQNTPDLVFCSKCGKKLT